jgi:hypothetical protein
MNAAADPMVARCMALDVDALLVLYADCARDKEPGATRFPAIALREKARIGALPVEVVPVLAVCLGDAEDPQTVRNLAKAIAAFGARARPIVLALIEKLKATHVTDDDSFWTFDSLLYALAYVGGDDARATLGELASRTPSPVLRSKSLYRGAVKDAQRSELFAQTIARAADILDAASAEGWREKKTDMAVLPIEKQTKAKPYQTR